MRCSSKPIVQIADLFFSENSNNKKIESMQTKKSTSKLRKGGPFAAIFNQVSFPRHLNIIIHVHICKWP